LLTSHSPIVRYQASQYSATSLCAVVQRKGIQLPANGEHIGSHAGDDLVIPYGNEQTESACAAHTKSTRNATSKLNLLPNSKAISSDPLQLCEAIIIRSSPQPLLESTYNAFLYTAVGEDKHGAPLTVLTALARQNVDPWDAAANLAKLPNDTATHNLQSLLAGLFGQTATTAEQSKVVSQLMALLPRDFTGSTQPQKAWHRLRSPRPQEFSAFVKTVWLGSICITLMCLTAQWLSVEFSTSGPQIESAHSLQAGPIDGAPSSIAIK
jgi:hypothetical protein